MFITLITVALSLQAFYRYPSVYASYVFCVYLLPFMQWKAAAYTAILLVMLTVMTAPPMEHEKQQTMRPPSTQIISVISVLGNNVLRRVESAIHSLKVKQPKQPSNLMARGRRVQYSSTPLCRVLALSALAMSMANSNSERNTGPFDTDLELVGIDN